MLFSSTYNFPEFSNTDHKQKTEDDVVTIMEKNQII